MEGINPLNSFIVIVHQVQGGSEANVKLVIGGREIMNYNDMKSWETKLLNYICLGQLLGKLPVIDRKLILDYYILELPYKEMIVKYGTTGKVISSRVRRIIKHLKSIS